MLGHIQKAVEERAEVKRFVPAGGWENDWNELKFAAGAGGVGLGIGAGGPIGNVTLSNTVGANYMNAGTVAR